MEVQETPSFHPAKRRKFIRNRAAEESESPDRTRTTEADDGLQGPIGSQSPVKSPEAADSRGRGDGEPTPAMGDILRFRKSHKRRGGIGFSAGNRPPGRGGGGDGNRPNSELSLAEQDGEEGRVLGMENRFVGHTGQSVDVDKHMMTYIESEMAKRRSEAGTEAAIDDDDDNDDETMDYDDDNAGEHGTGQRASEGKQRQRQPATLGKLHEIDLGPDAKLRNIARTEAATRRLTGGEKETKATSPAEEEDGQGKTTHDEKAAGRGRRGRNNEDVRRDQLVEEVLRESKLDVYQDPSTEAAGTEKGDDGQAADDRIAEQFRRDFLEAIQSRRRGARARARKETKTGTGAGKTGTGKPEVPRGPKLGGSRSARAAMREKQNKEAQQK